MVPFQSASQQRRRDGSAKTATMIEVMKPRIMAFRHQELIGKRNRMNSVAIPAPLAHPELETFRQSEKGKITRSRMAAIATPSFHLQCILRQPL
jgi:hypothetical protein